MTCFLYPDIGRVDEPLQLHMNGLVPNEKVTLTLTYDHRLTGIWRAECECFADEDGRLHLNNEEGIKNNPLVRLMWELEPKEGNRSPFLPHDMTSPMEFQVEVQTEESKKHISKTVQRLFKEDEVLTKQVKNHNVNGTLYYIDHEKDMPLIIVLGTTNELSSKYIAALLASQGYAALSLSYSLGVKKQAVPVESIQYAIDAVKNLAPVNINQVVLFGHSKWAELALLTASKNKSINGVIAYSPPSHVFHGKKNDIHWTENREPLPAVTDISWYQSILVFLKNKVRNEKVSQFSNYEQKLSQYKNKQMGDADLEVENIEGPVLLVSGGRDTHWPSEKMCEQLVERFEENKFHDGIRHLTYSMSGHTFNLPYLPSVLFSPEKHGGSKEDNAVCGADAWGETLAFLKKHFPPVTIEKETIQLQF
ncbi:acyl-CoA thioesterase/BAAT N-terminal domain-containing protein [Bacillus shivajii]|uniref:acyl-CoA thioesterase/bile acid-CoA:amino acid N-acyltransferase family protein n=1 Tax=Bacillus shivajii TaxID=1983719 RepID=UPI001CFB99D7|nr:acyl-CoA thioesterase/bile acid-CoA:amino acid N-acyltransferase family protein [Bacillus shivajii]UCZ54152.1 acyl-CoA thioesterase/BAAT N-terminal domain-containing protein [Bacillus shivajii]